MITTGWPVVRARTIIVDPFVGGGTVPVACIAIGRRYIGTEIDPGVATAARALVAEFRKAQPTLTELLA